MSSAHGKSSGIGEAEVANGTHREIDGRPCVYYDGYWIRYYPPPEEDTLAAKQALIELLTRRLFHHTEPGINTPGENLEFARAAYEAETEPARRRVKGAMLAGALFNRATDIFTSVVELASKGVTISPDDELMTQCCDYFQEALKLGTTVKHYSGHEGIDELWGEPLKAFAMPVKDFYESRYVKIAQTKRDIDRIAARVSALFLGDDLFEGFEERLRAFGEAAKLESETMRSDPVIFDIWPEFVATGEALTEFEPKLARNATDEQCRRAQEGMALIRESKDLVTYLSGARVPMPKSTREFLVRCDAYAKRYPRLSAAS